MNRRGFVAAACAAGASSLFARTASSAVAFDHAPWTALLRKHVVLLSNGQASGVRYAALQAEQRPFKAYLAQWSAVGSSAFQARRWPNDASR